MTATVRLGMCGSVLGMTVYQDSPILTFDNGNCKTSAPKQQVQPFSG
jgi:hypothetical protein